MSQMPILLLLLAAASFEHQAECGDPSLESMSWRVLSGEVIAVEANGELRLGNVVEWRRSLSPRVVRLVDVDVALPAATPFLKKLTGKKVTVWINGHAIDDTRVAGVVYRGDADINRSLLAQGLGRYAAPPAYSLSDYTACLHRIAEREARQRRRGLWK